MKICVLYCGNKANDPKLKALASKMAEGISSNGHDVDVFDINLEMGKIISFYEYVVVISCAVSYFSKNVPSNVETFLRSAGTVSGKRCSCYISKGCLRKSRVLQTLMQVLESGNDIGNIILFYGHLLVVQSIADSSHIIKPDFICSTLICLCENKYSSRYTGIRLENAARHGNYSDQLLIVHQLFS